MVITLMVIHTSALFPWILSHLQRPSPQALKTNTIEQSSIL
jgi:hypothetical protein